MQIYTDTYCKQSNQARVDIQHAQSKSQPEVQQIVIDHSLYSVQHYRRSVLIKVRMKLVKDKLTTIHTVKLNGFLYNNKYVITNYHGFTNDWQKPNIQYKIVSIKFFYPRNNRWFRINRPRDRHTVWKKYYKQFIQKCISFENGKSKPRDSLHQMNRLNTQLNNDITVLQLQQQFRSMNQVLPDLKFANFQQQKFKHKVLALGIKQTKIRSETAQGEKQIISMQLVKKVNYQSSALMLNTTVMMYRSPLEKMDSGSQILAYDEQQKKYYLLAIHCAKIDSYLFGINLKTKQNYIQQLIYDFQRHKQDNRPAGPPSNNPKQSSDQDSDQQSKQPPKKMIQQNHQKHSSSHQSPNRKEQIKSQQKNTSSKTNSPEEKLMSPVELNKKNQTTTILDYFEFYKKANTPQQYVTQNINKPCHNIDSISPSTTNQIQYNQNSNTDVTKMSESLASDQSRPQKAQIIFPQKLNQPQKLKNIK